LNFLNPQKSFADPRNTHSGNPYLGPEFLHHMEFNWGYSHKRRNINLNLDYDASKNVINLIRLVNPLDGVAHHTYLNTGRKSSTGFNLGRIMVAKIVKNFT
jgi:outer membrane receptor protein involved in Fe transport